MNRYLVIALRTAAFNTEVIPAHREFIDGLRAAGRLELSGPFTDKTGGAYLMKAESLERAREIVARDPVLVTGSSQLTVYEWTAS